MPVSPSRLWQHSVLDLLLFKVGLLELCASSGGPNKTRRAAELKNWVRIIKPPPLCKDAHSFQSLFQSAHWWLRIDHIGNFTGLARRSILKNSFCSHPCRFNHQIYFWRLFLCYHVQIHASKWLLKKVLVQNFILSSQTLLHIPSLKLPPLPSLASFNWPIIFEAFFSSSRVQVHSLCDSFE